MQAGWLLHGISIHAPREGSDPRPPSQRRGRSRFLSTLPARGATDRRQKVFLILRISIHAPREGSDALGAAAASSCRGYFYPRSPRGERQCAPFKIKQLPDFYPRSPRGERPAACRRWPRPSSFLSTLPARGATGFLLVEGFLYPRFLSTLPARGATLTSSLQHDPHGISIHAPREGSDLRPSASPPFRVYFYPRSPRGERLNHIICDASIVYISIHAPREGSDRKIHPRRHTKSHFYPRSPRGERPSGRR